MFSRYDGDALVEAINRYLGEEITAFKLDEAISEIAARTKDETVKVHPGGLLLEAEPGNREAVMSQSLLYHAFGVREGYDYVRTEYRAGAVAFHLAVREEQFVCPDCGSLARDPQRRAGASFADRADRVQDGIFGDPGSQVRGQGLRGEIRGGPPFAPAYVHYTHKLADYAQALSRVMTIADAAEVAGLSWDTVKDMVKERLPRRTTGRSGQRAQAPVD